MRRTLLAVALATVALLAPAGMAAAYDPILFVHGWSENESAWTTMIDNFEEEGWTSEELHNWRYDTSQSNATTAREVAAKVEEILRRTGAEQVDLVTHSMGGLSTRYYLKNLSGTEQVDDSARRTPKSAASAT